MRKILLSLSMIGIISVILYCLMEATLQIADNSLNIGGVGAGYTNFKKLADKKGVSVHQLAAQTHTDPQLGWGGSTPKPNYSSNSSYRILFYGDSVTEGVGVDDAHLYVAQLSNMLSPDSVQIYNLATAGYGIDQMIIKAENTASVYHPDLIVIAFIPHNLLRVGSGFLYDRTKPKYVINNNVLTLVPAQDLGEFYLGFKHAKDTFRMTPWMFNFLWKNKEYFLPVLYDDYYARAFSELKSTIETLSQRANSSIAIVKLSNSTEFRGREALESVAEKAFSSAGAERRVVYWDMDACTRESTRKKTDRLGEDLYVSSKSNWS